jgi:hypothetical protein
VYLTSTISNEALEKHSPIQQQFTGFLDFPPSSDIKYCLFLDGNSGFSHCLTLITFHSSTKPEIYLISQRDTTLNICSNFATLNCVKNFFYTSQGMNEKSRRFLAVLLRANTSGMNMS